jgi:TolB-like protein
MPQVFVSYARADKRQVAKLVSALRKLGFEPWWDDDIPAGAGWEETIERALADAEAVVVCWSPTSVASENVRSEARVARSKGRLVQVFIEACEPPLFFGERQGIELTNWSGSVRSQEAARLKQAVDAALAGSAAPSSAIPVRKASRPKPLVLAALIALIVITIGGGWWWLHGSAASAGAPRIAVQPIEALGADGSTTSLADGLTDQITAALNDGRVPTITRADSQGLKAGDVDSKLRTLGADYSINGTVERNGKTLRARLHLDDRPHHASLWSYETTGSADNPAGFNFSIGQAVAGVLSCVYRGLGPNGLADTELLSRYVRVCDLFVNHNDAADSKSTFELLGDLRQITAKAPNFAPAQSDFAKFAAYLAPLLPPEQAAALREESARHATIALSLDPRSADAWLAREMLRPPTDWAGREALLRKAVSVNPDWPHSNGFLGKFLMETGRMREAAIYGQRAAAADLQIDWRPYGASMACAAGQTDQVIPDLQQRLATAANDPTIRYSLRGCLLAAGMYREALKLAGPAKPGPVSLPTYLRAATEALASGSTADRSHAQAMIGQLKLGNGTLSPIIEMSAALGDVDTAFRLADQFTPGYPMTGAELSFLFRPTTASMRRDPRFFPLMKRFGLAQFWQSTGRWPDFCSGDQLAGCKAAIDGRATASATNHPQPAHSPRPEAGTPNPPQSPAPPRRPPSG